MKLRQWYAQRGPGYLRQRAASLAGRYGLTPTKATERVMASVALLADYGCAPTFPTPGRVVERYPLFCHLLQERGVEIAVHAYDHVDLSTYSPEEACEQLVHAVGTFDRHGLDCHGFRCPYLGCNDAMLSVLPKDLFSYSSNQAVSWDFAMPEQEGGGSAAMRDVLLRVYKPLSAQDVVCVPWFRSHLVEIPVTLPDDLTLHDGLRLGPTGLAQAWRSILHQTHRRGEAFVLMYHPELADRCQEAFATILAAAMELQPVVWIARLQDIAHWWREKALFSVELSANAEALHLSFTCSDRATILTRGLAVDGPEVPWDGLYRQLREPTLEVPAEPRPFVGLPTDAPADTVSFLRNQGYLLDLTETAPRCGIYLDAATLRRLTSQVDLVKAIEGTAGPLIRYWRWPDGAKSCLSITGDLDALTLIDYTARLFIR